MQPYPERLSGRRRPPARRLSPFLSPPTGANRRSRGAPRRTDEGTLEKPFNSNVPEAHGKGDLVVHQSSWPGNIRSCLQADTRQRHPIEVRDLVPVVRWTCASQGRRMRPPEPREGATEEGFSQCRSEEPSERRRIVDRVANVASVRLGRKLPEIVKARVRGGSGGRRQFRDRRRGSFRLAQQTVPICLCRHKLFLMTLSIDPVFLGFLRLIRLAWRTYSLREAFLQRKVASPRVVRRLRARQVRNRRVSIG